MNTDWLPLSAVAPGGSEYILTDQAVWTTPLAEFKMACVISKPLRAEIFVLPQEDGVLVRGSVTGEVTVPCDRCAEDTVVPISVRFDSFEPYPAPEPFPQPASGRSGRKAAKSAEKFAEAEEARQLLDNEVDYNVIRLAAHGQGVEINLAALAWEEFALEMPVKPLCAPDCPGLCPICGASRKSALCSCETGPADARLAPLRNLKIVKK